VEQIGTNATGESFSQDKVHFGSSAHRFQGARSGEATQWDRPGRERENIEVLSGFRVMIEFRDVWRSLAVGAARCCSQGDTTVSALVAA
jgi:hypothetical protein